MRVLVAGAGRFGREHLVRLADRAEVVAVADVDADALAQARSQFRIGAGYADPIRMIDETPADAIVVATPVASHVEICARALGAGLCALLEKPVAPSAAAAESLLAAAQGARGFVLPGHVLRFSSDHRKLVEIVHAGRIGETLYVNSRRYRDDSHALRYNTDPVLMTLIHDIDLAQWVTGSQFSMAQSRRTGGTGLRTMTAVSATTATGVLCELRTAWTFPGAEAPPDRFEVVGARGSVELIVGEGLCVYEEGRRADQPADLADDPLRNEQDHFLGCVANRSLKPALGLAEALAGLRLADAVMQSLRTGGEAIV